MERPLVRDWRDVDEGVYRQAYEVYGGSFATHPDLLSAMEELGRLPARYRAAYRGEDLIGAFATWDGVLAGNNFSQPGLPPRVDLGMGELILPLDPNVRFELPCSGCPISDLHRDQIARMQPWKQLSLARPHQRGKDAPGVGKPIGSKSLYNHRRQKRLIEEQGGGFSPVTDLSARDLAQTLRGFHRTKWGRNPVGNRLLVPWFERIRPYQFGQFAHMGGRPIAVQILYRVASARGLYVEFVQFGWDGDLAHLSPSSVLMFVNIQAAHEEAQASGVALRLSLGLSPVERNYKDMWATRTPSHELQALPEA